MKNIYKNIKGTKIRTGFIIEPKMINKDKLVKYLKTKFDDYEQGINKVSDLNKIILISAKQIIQSILEDIEEGKYE